MRARLLCLVLLPTIAGGIEIPDRNLESVLRSRLGVHDRELTPADLAMLTELRALERGIVDLTGLEHAVNLESAILECNDIVDLAPLAGMTRLRELDLGDNDVLSIAPLATATALEDLQLGGNDIVDISAIANLTLLTHLNIGFNEIVDLSPLAALTSLDRLSLSSNPITDFSPITGIAIHEMDLRSLHLEDISFLASLDGIVTLGLSSNRISDLEPLEELPSLVNLSLGGNNITSIGPLAELPNLEYLSLAANRISDASPLAAHPSLQHVSLSYNRIASLDPLATIPGIRSIELSSNLIESIDSMTGIDTLDWIYLDRNFIDVSSGSDATAIIVGLEQAGTLVYSDPQLALEPVFIPDPNLEQAIRDELAYAGELTTLQMAQLYSFDAESQSIGDLTGLEHAIYIEELRLGENRITDLSPLALLRRVHFLELFDNHISDVEPLRRLSSLQHLDLSENNISSTGHHFQTLWRLERLEINDNPLTHLAIANPFRLTYLDTGDCLIADLSDLTRATRLEELNISRNPILTDLGPVATLQNLRLLRANHLPLGAPDALAPLSGLPALEILWLADSEITDLSHLSDLPALESLYLQDNAITDVSPLGSLPRVRVLELDHNLITDFTPITNLGTVRYLNLENNLITSIPDLSGLTSLLNIDLEHNAITHIDPLLSAPDGVLRFDLEQNYVDPLSPGAQMVADEIRIRGGFVDLDDQRTPPVARIPALAIGLDPNAPATLTISFTGEAGVSYQLRFSEDLARSQAIGPPVMGDGSPVEFAQPFPAAPDGFFTVVATVVQ